MAELLPNSRTRMAKIALAVVAGALGTAVIGAAVWTLYEARRPKATSRQTEIEPAEETTDTTPVVPGGGSETSGSAPSTRVPSAEPTAPPSGSSGVPTSQRRMIVYRVGERLWVAREDGSSATPVSLASSTYALSPDGSRIAVIMDPPRSTGRVSIYDTSGRLRIGGLGAYPGSIAWSPDGSSILYSAGTLNASSIRQISPDGSGDRRVVSPGSAARFSPDGRFIVYIESAAADADDRLWLLEVSTGGSTAISGARGAASFTFASDGTLYFTKRGSSRNAWDVWRAHAPYRAIQRAGSIAVQTPAYALCDLHVSVDGTRLLTGARGDDRYCRVWVMDLASGKATQLQTRRDAIPYGWTAAGRILYFEGNTYQGEASSLMSANPDGSNRRVLVEGAAR